jgi:hypothetical protein
MFWVEYVFVGVAYMHPLPAPYLTLLRLSSFGDETRADVATLLFQIWLLGLSMAAIFQDSIPHTYVISVAMTLHHAHPNRIAASPSSSGTHLTPRGRDTASRARSRSGRCTRSMSLRVPVWGRTRFTSTVRLRLFLHFYRPLTYHLRVFRASADAPLRMSRSLF